MDNSKDKSQDLDRGIRLGVTAPIPQEDEIGYILQINADGQPEWVDPLTVTTKP